MKGYNFNRAETGAYSDEPEVEGGGDGDKNTTYDLSPDRCVYGDMEGVPFLLIVGPDAADNDAYYDVTKFYMEYYEHYTSVVIKMGDENLPDAPTFAIEYYDGDGRIGTHYADLPTETNSGTAMGVNHDGRSHNAYQPEDRQGIDESYQDGEYFYSYSHDGSPIWSGPDEGQWSAGEVLIVAPSAEPPSRWPDGAITETTLDATIDSDIQSKMCPGDSATVTIEMSNDHVASDIIGQINYETMGGGSVEDFIVEPGRSETIEIDVVISENALPIEQEVLSFDITSDADVNGSISRSFASLIGTQPDEVSMENVELPSEVVEGRDIDGSVDVSNGGDCSTDVTVSYTTN